MLREIATAGENQVTSRVRAALTDAVARPEARKRDPCAGVERREHCETEGARFAIRSPTTAPDISQVCIKIDFDCF